MNFFPHDQIEHIPGIYMYNAIFVKKQTLLSWPMVAPLVVSDFGHGANLFYIYMV